MHVYNILTKLRTPRLNGPLVVTFKPKATATFCMKYFKCNISMQIFLNVNLTFHELKVSGTNVVLAPPISTSATSLVTAGN